MHYAVSAGTRVGEGLLTALASRVHVGSSTVVDYGAAVLSAVLLVLSFPDFNLWFLAWLALTPLLIVVARKPAPWRAFLLAWVTGTLFFYGSCHWLTYSMVRYGGIPVWTAYLLLIPGALVLGLFPGVSALVLARAIKAWGMRALLIAPALWSALEWARLETTGQLWNAIGYSQAYHPNLIQSARWGGVYAVGFLIVAVNSALALVILRRDVQALVPGALGLAAVAAIIFASNQASRTPSGNTISTGTVVIALQPNVPMDPVKSPEEIQDLIDRLVSMSQAALRQLGDERSPRLIIWPESPMNFTYAADPEFRKFIAEFASRNKTAVLFNTQEPAPGNGSYNSALLVDEEGCLIAQYDKIRLLPFGEYVPLPHWLPGASLVSAIVGDFRPGAEFTLMPLGSVRAGVFICIESAYPFIAQTFTREGADVLINISNDGYLGPTAVMRQHLANAVLRAVENGRPVLRVTNTGISAYITANGVIRNQTNGFQSAVRTWTIGGHASEQTFYTQYGDLFAAMCAVIGLLTLAVSFRVRSKREIRG